MSRGDNQLPRVSFDDEYRVRVLDKESIAHTQELQLESNQFATSQWLELGDATACGHEADVWRCMSFLTELEEFHEIVKGVLEVLEGQAKRIEREKLKVALSQGMHGWWCIKS